MHLISFFLLFMSIGLTGCLYKRRQKRLRIILEQSISKIETFSKNLILEPHSQQQLITIWIHGTRIAPPGIFSSFFFCPEGLTLASDLDKKYHMRTIADTLTTSAPYIFPPESFYLFGWSGKLSNQAREKAAVKLAQELTRIMQAHKKKYLCSPRIQIIAHSHGGNVALFLEKFRDHLLQECTIERLILLACPIQQATACYAASDIFTSIHNLYSTMDTVQVLDPQGFHNYTLKPPFFSERCFIPAKKIIQTQLKWNGRGIMHIEFILPRFLKLLPFILHTAEKWHKHEKKYDRARLIHLKLTL